MTVHLGICAKIVLASYIAVFSIHVISGLITQ